MSTYSNVERTPLYFGDPHHSLFGWYHAPKNNAQSLVMVICPPIGYEYVHSHRSLRHLADHFAQAGISSLRFDYHGTGDSAGMDEDPDRISAWLASIKSAINQARSLSGCERVGLLGFRMGATFAAMIAAETKLACLVMWAPCLRGRGFTREMKALRMTGRHETLSRDSHENIIEGGGFVLTQQTVDELATIDMRKVIPKRTDVMVLMRDDLTDTSQKLDQWVEQGLDVEYRTFSGYADMVAEPHYTKVPFDAIEKIINWVTSSVQLQTDSQKTRLTINSDLDQFVSQHRLAIVHPSDYEIAKIGGSATEIEESILHFGKGNRLFGILSKPSSDEWKTRPTVILANAGAVHHVGPNRLYVLLTRNLSRSGFRCLRMDLPGLGDSFIELLDKENDSYVASASQDIAAAINALRVEAKRFVVMGLCSGAHAAFHVALDLKSQPIEECFLINPLTFYWKEGMSLSAPPNVDNRWHYYKHTMRNKQRWIKFLRGQANTRAILNTVKEKAIKTALNTMFNVLELLKLGSRPGDNLNRDIKDACSDGRRLSFVFSSQDPGFDILMSNAKSAVRKCINRKLIDIQFIEGADHTFTTRVHRIELTKKLISHFASNYNESYKK